MKEEKPKKRFYSKPAFWWTAYFGVAIPLAIFNPELSFSGYTGGESKPKLEERIELPKVELPELPKTPEKTEGYVDILVDLNQKLGDERETLTATDLPNLLKSSKIGPTQVNQYLRFTRQQNGQNISFMEDPKTRTVIQGQNERDENGYFLFFRDGDPIFDYELEFQEGFETEVDKDGNLTDLIGSHLNILGDRYLIAKAKTDGDGVDLTLVSGRIFKHDFYKKININGKRYDVEVTLIAFGGIAEYRVNRELLGELSPGQSVALKNGAIFTHLGTEVPEELAPSLAEYTINSNVMRWKDSKVLGYDQEFDEVNRPEHNNEVIEEGKVKIRASWIEPKNKSDKRKLEITNIVYCIASDGVIGDVHLGKGENLREALDEPEGLASTKLNIRYQGQHKNGKHIVRVSGR